jgi:hypothetical protein
MADVSGHRHAVFASGPSDNCLSCRWPVRWRIGAFCVYRFRWGAVSGLFRANHGTNYGANGAFWCCFRWLLLGFEVSECTRWLQYLDCEIECEFQLLWVQFVWEPDATTSTHIKIIGFSLRDAIWETELI